MPCCVFLYLLHGHRLRLKVLKEEIGFHGLQVQCCAFTLTDAVTAIRVGHKLKLLIVFHQLIN